jgi:hypothetical protein
MYGSIFENLSVQNTHYKVLVLGQELSQIEDSIERPVDVTDQFPYWITTRHSSDSLTHNLVNFVQYYYDWLYTKSGYELNTTSTHISGVNAIMDIDETPAKFLKSHIYSYASGLSSYNLNNEESISATKVRNFIKGIRSNLYQKKSNEEAYRYFFQSLYGVNGSDISISYPKKNIMRLNGGKFAGWPEEGFTSGYYETTHHLGGSFLNGDFKFQDGSWYQDFSYILHAGIDDEFIDDDSGLPLYYNELTTMLHPAGLKGFFEKTISDYIPPDDYDGGVIHGEEPVLQNYFPYRLGDTAGYTACMGCLYSPHGYDGPTAYIGATFGAFGGPSGGWTLGDAWGAVGGGSLTTHFNKPTYNFPSWTDDITAGTKIGDIYIGDFVYLYPASDSPNVGITGCTAHGESTSCWLLS